MSNNKTPAWLSVDNDGCRIRLSRPSDINHIQTNKIFMRVPVMGDLRAAQRQAPGDSEQQEVLVFASLMDCGVTDVEKLSVRDYRRVQEAYFRLVADEDHADGDAAAGASPGD